MRAEIKIGFTVITAILIAFTGFKILQDNPVFRATTQLFTNFESVDGLTKGSYVYVNGVKVGSVNSLELNPDMSVRVGLNFTNLSSIPMGTTARLADMDLLGTKAVLIDLGDGTPIAYGEEIPGKTSRSTMDELTETGTQVMQQVEPTLETLNVGLNQLNELLNERNRADVSGILGNVRQSTFELSAMLEENRSELQSSMQHVNKVLGQLDTLSTQRRPELDQLIVNLEKSTREIDQLIASTDSLASSLDALVRNINQGEGSLAKMVNDSSMYVNVNNVSFELARMLKQMNDNPKYYFKHVKIRLF